MPTTNGLEVVPSGEALALAATAAVGRIALIVGGAPVVVPVNFALLDGDVVIRTASSSKLLAAMTGAVVSFEVDEFDTKRRSGWSVLITGPARELSGEERDAAEALGIDAWAGNFDRYVRITSQLVSGRRIRPGPPAAEDWFAEWTPAPPLG